MSILILYLSKHGTVKEVVEMMQNISGEQVDIKKLNSHITGSVIEKYDSLIVGGSIHMGKAPRKLTRFSKNYSHFFHEKKSGIFLCTLTDPKEADPYLIETFTKEVCNKVHAKGLFGGAIKYENMNFFEKAIMKKITREKKSFSKIDSIKIAAFIESF